MINNDSEDEEFNNEMATLYANPKHKECRGRGYIIQANPGQNHRKIYCQCVINNYKKVMRTE